jgi:hypothetical protein
LLMHAVHPPTSKLTKPGMLRFWHMEWGKVKGKSVLPSTYVLFWYALEEWQQKVAEINTKLKGIG